MRIIGIISDWFILYLEALMVPWAIVSLIIRDGLMNKTKNNEQKRNAQPLPSKCPECGATTSWQFKKLYYEYQCCVNTTPRLYAYICPACDYAI